jgi:hypothetical protein
VKVRTIRPISSRLTTALIGGKLGKVSQALALAVLLVG